MNEVKPLFDKNNETNYIATEANVKPIYTADMKRDYRSEIVDCNYEIHKSLSLEERLKKLEERWEKSVTVTANFAPSKTEEGKYDMSKIVTDVKIEPYPVDKLTVEI